MKTAPTNLSQRSGGSGHVLEESRLLIERTNRMLETLANMEAKEVKVDKPLSLKVKPQPQQQLDKENTSPKKKTKRRKVK